MIDQADVVKVFNAKFSSMSYEEREEFLRKMGFSFGKQRQVHKPLGKRRTIRIEFTQKNARPIILTPSRVIKNSSKKGLEPVLAKKN